MYTYQTESFDDVYPDIVPLFRNHYKEVERDQDKLPLNPDYEMYRTIEQSGHLRIFTVRYKDKLVGYSVYIVHPNLHHKDILFAVGDVLFIESEHRRGGSGVKLIIHAEAVLRDQGVKVVITHGKYDSPIRKLFERLDYEKDEMVYRKFL